MALVTLVTPVVALLLGATFNGEPVGPQVWLGTGLILAGLALHQWGGLRRRGEARMMAPSTKPDVAEERSA